MDYIRNMNTIYLSLASLPLIVFGLSCGLTYEDAPPEPKRVANPNSANTSSGTQMPSTIKALTGKCDWQDQDIFRHNSAFTRVWRTVGVDSWGNSQSTANGIRQSYPDLTSACARCFGNFVECGKDNCKFACVGNAERESCKQCGKQNCGRAWEKCSGFALSILAE